LKQKPHLLLKPKKDLQQEFEEQKLADEESNDD
jgi:hypothetical protein